MATHSLADSDKAWHLLAVLLSLCRRARPSELALRCKSFRASPQLVQRLCSLAGSPISLSDDLYVVPSSLAVNAFTESISHSGAGDALRSCLQKPKRFFLECGSVPSAKRRFIADFENVSGANKSLRHTLPTIHFHTTDDLSKILEVEDYEDTIPAKNRLIRVFETSRICPAYDLSVGHKQFFKHSAIAFDHLVHNEGANIHEIDSTDKSCLEKTKQSIMLPVLDENVSGSCKVPNGTIVEDDRTMGDEKKKLFVDPGNPHGETENISQPCTAVLLPEVYSIKLKEEEYVGVIPLNRKLSRDETRTKCQATDFSVAEKKSLKPSETVSSALVLYEGANMHETGSMYISHPENTKQSFMSEVLDGFVSGTCKVTHAAILEKETIVRDEKEKLVDHHNPNRETKNAAQLYTAVSDMLPAINSRRMKGKVSVNTIPVNERRMRRHDSQTTCLATDFSISQKQLLKTSAMMKAIAIPKDKFSSRIQSPYAFGLGKDHIVATPKMKHHLKMDQETNSMVHKSKQNCTDLLINGRKRRYKSISSKEEPEKKKFPKFESYMVEEEEGSGGYGTVYKAWTKNDRTKVAIKCPHANAHKHHVNNELKMLERFGGKNFVIKYEGCIKNGNSNCFVLQHIEHDKPEVLKAEIDISQLQWYGYCMFRALASLHKQGIVHRDVKPGNFLFSREANKGYLIDFNLAMDLHQKSGNTGKSRRGFDVNSNDQKLTNAKELPPITLRKFPSGKSFINGEMSKGLKSTFDMKDLKKMAFGQMKAKNDSGSIKVMKSQGADGSSITSLKDVTSTRTPSAERLREPLPCQGRKELISLAQEARQSPNHEVSSVSVRMRKGAPAASANVDGKLFHVTPMPVYSTANGMGGPYLIRSRGVEKHKKEGPCAGTNGYRAPEVLLRSPHQGPKIDIWSAGVTLLYFLIGRTPFFGESEQNIKDIAKLRGSEELWEVAKLHERESSFPEDLYSTECLRSMKLQDWCRRSTKRPDFFEEIPRSLFDLVDKCLAVHPRLRISAEEALKHNFFAHAMKN